MKKTKKFIISQIFFFITISLIANKVFFSHIHILPNGKIIVHSHPYSKKTDNSKKANHAHTKFSFYVIEQSNRFDDTLVEFQDFKFEPHFWNIDYLVHQSHPTVSNSINSIDKRGPPAA